MKSTPAWMPEQPRRRLRWLWISLAALTVVALAGGAYLIGTRHTSNAAAAGPSTTTTTAAAGTAPARLDATAALARLVAAGLPITHSAVQDEYTDPNRLLGRPGGYTSRASFELADGDPNADLYDVGRGGAIEVFADAAGARRRSDFIQGLIQAMPILGTEYDYLAGPVLVRITGRLTPSAAAPFAAAVTALPQ